LALVHWWKSTEDLISKKGDQTYILAHTLVQSVVVRWVVESESWILLQAEGDTVANSGIPIMMFDMLEPMFPYKRAMKYDLLRIKFDQNNLRNDQKDLLNDLSGIITDIIKHFDNQFLQLPRTASIEEISDLGNEKNWKSIEYLIHERLCGTLANIFSDGINRGYWFWENYCPWDFIRSSLSTKEGVYTDTAFSTEELEVSTVVAKLDLNNQIPDKSQKLWGLFCEGLMSRNFSSWIKTLLTNKIELERCYIEESLLRSKAMEGVIDLIGLLSGFPFSLKYVYVPKPESR